MSADQQTATVTLKAAPGRCISLRGDSFDACQWFMIRALEPVSQGITSSETNSVHSITSQKRRESPQFLVYITERIPASFPNCRIAGSPRAFPGRLILRPSACRFHDLGLFNTDFQGAAGHIRRVAVGAVTISVDAAALSVQEISLEAA